MKQREVYKAIGEQMKKQESAALNQLFDSTINNIYTSIDTEDLLGLISRIADYQVVDDEDHVVSQEVKEISDRIKAETD